ncbi:MAG TPA: hypothetical protein VF600_01065 [Abditibacteriaceae bacterium]
MPRKQKGMQGSKLLLCCLFTWYWTCHETHAAALNPFVELHAYAANLHSHTQYSDEFTNLHTPLTAFEKADGVPIGKPHRLDVLAVTDHAELLTPHSVDARLFCWHLQRDRLLSPLVGLCRRHNDADEWRQMGLQAQKATRPDSFVALRGFEWSADGGQPRAGSFPCLSDVDSLGSEKYNIGHINVLGTQDYVGHHYVHPDYMLFQMSTLEAMFTWIESLPQDEKPICQFNHPNLYSSKPFRYSSAVLGLGRQPLSCYQLPPPSARVRNAFALMEVGTHHAPTLSGKYSGPERAYHSITNTSIWQEALRQGWRLAPSLNEDNHTGDYGEKNLRTMIWAPALTPGLILESLVKRHVFATEDKNLILKFWLENASHRSLGIMGDTITYLPNSPTDKLISRVQITGTKNRLASIEIVPIFRNPLVLPPRRQKMQFNPVDGSYSSILQIAANFVCCYARVKLADGRLALSAPIWINGYASKASGDMTGRYPAAEMVAPNATVNARRSGTASHATPASNAMDHSPIAVAPQLLAPALSDLVPVNYTFHEASQTAPTSWFDAANWSPNGVPTAKDSVTIAAGRSISLDNDVTVARLRLIGGTIFGNGNIRVLKVFEWSAGVLDANVTVAAGSVTRWSGGILRGSLSIPSNARLELGGASAERIQGGVLNHTGNIKQPLPPE